MEQQKFTYKIDTDNHLPIEDFAKALVAINEEYKQFSHGACQLEIAEIRKGSFEVDFTPIIVPTLFSAIENANSIWDFITHIKYVKDFIIGNNENIATAKPAAQSVKNCAEIISPVINNFGTINLYSGNKQVSIDNGEAKQIKAFVPSILKDIPSITQEHNSNMFKKQLFYWYQTRFDDKKTNSGNKGIIEAISPEAVNVIFEDDHSLTKQEMTTSQDGVEWQKVGYIVDVEVMRKGDKIVKYKILRNYMEDCVADGFLF